MTDFLSQLTEEDIILLVRSVLIRAKSGLPEAVKRAENLKRDLIS